MALSDDEKALLAFEGVHWKHPGLKDEAIREQFEISPTRYYQRLNRLIDEPEAYAYAPTLVKRLRRLREDRQAARSARRIRKAS